MTKTQSALSYDPVYIASILQDFEQYKIDLNGHSNVKIFCKERNINISTFRNWLQTKNNAPTSLIRKSLQAWVKIELKKGNKVTIKELMNKINQDYPTVSENKKYNAKGMFAKRIIDNVTPESRYKTIQNNIYKTTPKPHPNTHSKIPKSKKQLELFDTGFKGFGVRSCHKIKKGSFIIEYVGEIIERHEYEQKMYKKKSKVHHERYVH